MPRLEARCANVNSKCSSLTCSRLKVPMEGSVLTDTYQVIKKANQNIAKVSMRKNLPRATTTTTTTRTTTTRLFSVLSARLTTCPHDLHLEPQKVTSIKDGLSKAPHRDRSSDMQKLGKPERSSSCISLLQKVS